MTIREELEEAVRRAGIEWCRQNRPNWRDNPWKDGILVDLDEYSATDMIIEEILKTQPLLATVVELENRIQKLEDKPDPLRRIG